MLYALLNAHISFPILGTILNAVYYGLIMAGIVCSSLLICRTLIHLEIPTQRAVGFTILVCILALPAGLISSRAANMFYFPITNWNWNFFVEQFVNGRNETFHAALILPFLLVTLLMKIMKIDIRPGWDAVFLHIPLAHAFGRMGCFLVGCCWGNEVQLTFIGKNWRFENPVPLYALSLNVLLYFILKRTFRRVYDSPLSDMSLRGAVAALYLILYGCERLGLEYLRKEPIVALGMTQGQIAMIGFIGLGFLLLIWVYWKRHAVDSPATP